MKSLVSPLLVAGALALVPADLAGQSFQREWIPASANWVVHIDVEGLVDTQLARELGLVDELNRDGELREFKQQFGMAPHEDITSVTLFGPRDDPESAVALVATTSNVDEALATLEQQVPHTSVKVDGFALQKWSGDGETLFSYVAENRDTDQRLAILSSDERDVAAALRVLRGETPSMRSTGKLSVASPPGSGALVYIAAGEAATNFAKREADVSHMAEMVESFVMEAGEDGDEMYLKFILQTDSSDSAKQVAQIAQGAIAFGALAANSEPEMAPLADMLTGLSLRADGSSLRAQWRQSTPRLMQLIRENADLDLHIESGGEAEYKVERSLKSKGSGESKTGWQ